MNFNTDLNYGRIMDLDMVLSSSLGLVMSTDPGGGKGHPDWHGPSGPWTPTDSGCSRAVESKVVQGV